MRQLSRDRFGLGYRSALASGVLAHLDRIDVVEVIAESLRDATRKQRSAMQTLTRQVPVVLHGVALGLASAADVSEPQLDALARVADWLQPESISEHLAFVRAGGIDIGHLAAPPRTRQTVDGTLRNVGRAQTVLGRTLHLENVATLIEPPASDCDEPEWIAQIVDGSGSGLLLDLHNLYTNACNFGDGLRTAQTMLSRLPCDRVQLVHLAGGRSLRSGDGKTLRMLDDHLHPVPDAVFTLLADVATRTPRPLTVIVERDGAYPPFVELLAEIERARSVVAQVRARPVERVA